MHALSKKSSSLFITFIACYRVRAFKWRSEHEEEKKGKKEGRERKGGEREKKKGGETREEKKGASPGI